MQLPTGKLDTLRAGVDRIIMDLIRATGVPDAAPAGVTSLPMLAQAFGQLFDVMQRVEADRLAQRTGAGRSNVRCIDRKPAATMDNEQEIGRKRFRRLYQTIIIHTL